MRKYRLGCSLAIALCGGLLAGCEYQETAQYVVQVAGSSTVSPVSSAVAEEADKVLGIKATVETTGTGPGMERLSRKECDISGASRPIKEKELEKCRQNGFEPIEFEICIDGLTVAVHPENTWCNCLTIEQLKKLWEFNSSVQKWSDLDPSWPNEDIKLFGPDHDSGTFDYFIEAVIGDVPEEQSPCRTDYTQSVNDTTLVDGVKGSKYSLGYFGFAYYLLNQQDLKALGIAKSADGSDCVVPTRETIGAGDYVPLSRPLFIYVNKESLLTKPEVAKFVDYYLNAGQSEVGEVGYIELPSERIDKARETLKQTLAERRN
ncbi:MAG: PstS family phosphate ABC transporter substrate-binding protein [Planctomycetaceae bacterium]|nr:PstS family phosphate ABC transporter substrate-binding protein [Planctomycetaceae bacterium]